MVLNPTEIHEHSHRLSFAVELDTMKALGGKYPESRTKEIEAKTWPLAIFLSGR
jgi:hypothetical protein